MNLAAWGERYFYAPSLFQKTLSYLLLPLSLLYCAFMARRFRRTDARDFFIPVISVGNLTVGGSGKTPLTVALAESFERPAVVLRGYGRKSRGLFAVSDAQQLLCDVEASGDEAMIYATLLPHAVVIVSEDRTLGIEKAKRYGCECVLLDDGYGKHFIKKLDIVIDVETPNRFCLPSGPYRERLWQEKKAVLVAEGREFTRRVTVENAAETMALVTAIARPQRLEPFLPPVVSRHYFPDHHYFTREELQDILRKTGAERLLVTYKDYVKIRHFNLPLALMELTLDVDTALIERVKRYVREHDENED